jgi:PAS domain S-box-containing protein
MLKWFRHKFSAKLVVLIGLVFIIPVVTSLATLVLTSSASLKKFDQALVDDDSVKAMVREVFPHVSDEQLGDPRALIQNLKQYEQRRTFGLFVGLIVISFVLAGVVVVLSMLILKRGMLSLHELSLASARVGDGDLDVVPISWSQDEFADLTEAFKTMTKRLKETTVSRDFYNHVLESMPAAVFTMDNEDVITTWNPQAAQLTGLSAQETVGRSIKEIEDVVGESIDRSELPMFGRESVIRERDGEQRIVSKGVDFLYDRSGTKNGVIETFIDISEQKKLERELVIAKERAEESSRLRSEFLANMSHEIRTPLNGIMGLAEVMGECEEDPEKRSNLNTIGQCGKNLLHLINEILELSKLEAGKMVLNSAIISMAEVTHNATATMAVSCDKKGIELRVAVADDVPDTIETDGLKLIQILLNLLGNSLKFTEKGYIKLSVDNCRGERRGDLQFAIEDTGCGISCDRKSSIFESFVQAEGYLNRGGDGTGLGLTITRKLVALMGGEIWLESEEGRGSIFYFTIESGVSLKDLDRR